MADQVEHWANTAQTPGEVSILDFVKTVRFPWTAVESPCGCCNSLYDKGSISIQDDLQKSLVNHHWFEERLRPGMYASYPDEWPTPLPGILPVDLEHLVFNDLTSIDLVIFHAGCLDGLLSAYSAYLSQGHEPHFYAVHHGANTESLDDEFRRLLSSEPPERESRSMESSDSKCKNIFDCDISHVYKNGSRRTRPWKVVLLDFCYPPKIMEELFVLTEGQLLVIDHHKTAADVIRSQKLLTSKNVLYHPNMAGCTLAWSFFYRKKLCNNGQIHVPLLYRYVEDQDICRYAMFSSTNYFVRGAREFGRTARDFNRMYDSKVYEMAYPYGRDYFQDVDKFVHILSPPDAGCVHVAKEWTFVYLDKFWKNRWNVDPEGTFVVNDCIQSAYSWSSFTSNTTTTAVDDEAGGEEDVKTDFRDFSKQKWEFYVGELGHDPGSDAGDSCYNIGDTSNEVDLNINTTENSLIEDRSTAFSEDHLIPHASPWNPKPLWNGESRIVTFFKLPGLKALGRNSLGIHDMPRTGADFDFSFCFYYSPISRVYKVTFRSSEGGADVQAVARQLWPEGSGGGHVRLKFFLKKIR